MTCGLASVQGWPLNIGPLYTGSTLFSIFKFKSPEVVRPVNVLPTCRVMSASMTIKGGVADDIWGVFSCFLYFLKPLQAYHKFKVLNKS